MKEKKKKTFDLVSSNEEVNSVLNNMKSNSIDLSQLYKDNYCR